VSLPFDQERYRSEVLDPARRNTQELPGDLLVRYAVTPAAEQDAVGFTEHLEEVEKYWRSLGQQHRSYRQLTTRLLAAHEQLRERRELSYAFFVDQSREHREEVLAKLENRIRGLAQGPVSRAQLDQILAGLSVQPTESELAEVLTRHDVVVVELWSLPDPVSPTQLGDLAKNLSVLGLRLAAEAVLGTEAVRAGFRIHHGFRLVAGNAGLTGPQIEMARVRLDTKAQDHRKTAAATVLSILVTAAAKPADLDRLLLWQLIDQLKASQLPVQAVVQDAVELGLDRAEATELALTLAARAGDPAEETRREIHAALSLGELREAQRLSASLPPKDDLRARVEQLVEAVERLQRDADEARRAGKDEEAAKILTQAIRIAGDDEELSTSLLQLAPPTPVGVRARVDGDQVRLDWDEPLGFTEGLAYLVVRRPATTGVTGEPRTWPKVAETRELTATDGEPPMGEELHYVVLATRGGAWSEGAAVTCPIVAPEVTGFRTVSRDLVVFGSWRPHPRAHGVVVLRAEGAPPPPSSLARTIPATPTDFRDDDIRAGRRVYYRVRSVYRTQSGGQYLTTGVLDDAMPAAVPPAVEDLEIDLTSGAARISWTPPRDGRVELRLHTAPPDATTGAELAVSELPAVGRALIGRVLGAVDGRAGFVAEVPAGHSWITAVTIAGDLAVVGRIQELTMISPVRDLRARRVGARITLTWLWPEAVELCRVEWEGRTKDCGRRRFVDDGGLTVDAGARPVRLTVRSVARDQTSETLGPPVSVLAPAASTEVRYSVHRGRVLRRGRAVLTFRSESSTRLPALTIVHSGASVRPLRPDQGRAVGRLAEQDIGPTLPVSVTVKVPRSFGPRWVLAFADDRNRDDVVLVQAGRR
jgi:hypothetical protein